MAFREMIARFAKGDVRSDQLTAIAMQAIEEGYDSPSLCQLAVLEGADPQRATSLFLKALDEIQIRLPCADPFIVVRRYRTKNRTIRNSSSLRLMACSPVERTSIALWTRFQKLGVH
jgi:hypothetical protein